MSTTLVVSAFILGVGGSLHCLGMCGPLVMALPFGSTRTEHTALNLSLYLVSKALMYGVLGLAVGAAGLGFKWITGQLILSVAAGIFVLAVTLWPWISRKMTLSFDLSDKIRSRFQKLLSHPAWYSFVLYGIFNALLPCVMILVAFGASAATGHPLSGFAFMFVFGLGTVPALLAAYFSGTMITRRFRLNLQWTSRVIAILLGVVLVIRGLNIHIPHSSLPLINHVSKIISCPAPE
ncbi:MAG TPA: sulfite exporter TauE/SafE family protein [Saprospiraceae bacterium]|nr:sulfite exporter TauE/SafE family protein [Saprospiraceae bacterium]HNT19361.1 sulfite exporter TauE/SafE family protein [Saprospiraceae bacterium]